jgi:hypothetical protein
MLTYEKLKQSPRRLLSLTSLTVDEIEHLLPIFEQLYLKKYPVTKTKTGKARKRKAGAGRKGSLAAIEQKLLFALVYQKSYPLQSVMGELFGIGQSQASEWIHVLLPTDEFLQCDINAGANLQKSRHGTERATVDSPWQLPGEFVVDKTGAIRLAYRYQYCEDWSNLLVLVGAIKEAIWENQ